MTTSNGFAGKSAEWQQGYQAGVDAFAAEMKTAQERGVTLAKRPVAFRVRNTTNNAWVLFEHEDAAEHTAQLWQTEVQGLYARGE